MSERAQSFAAIQSLMNTNAMHQNSVANIDQLKNNYAQQTDQETNKASEDIKFLKTKLNQFLLLHNFLS